MNTKEIAISIVKKLQDAGHIAYFAGGWVRDFLLGHPSDDIDIATSAAPQEVEALFARTVPVGIAFGIVLIVEKGVSFEVATFREDLSYKDGRRPIGYVNSNPEEDAKRRDFTINGMFYDPIAEKLYDFIGGKEDLQKGIIRAIGDPYERFREDRLRMMRAVRYATRFGFPIEEKTREAICALSGELLPAVAMERVWQEFQKMSRFTHFGKGLAKLYKLGLLQTIFPELKDVGIEEVERRVAWLEKAPKECPTPVQLFFLFPREPLSFWERLGERLKLSREEKELLDYTHRLTSLFEFPLRWQKELDNYEWVCLYAHPAAEAVLASLGAHLPEGEKENFSRTHRERLVTLASPIERCRKKKTLLSAQDLQAAGVSPSPLMGALLAEGERLAVNRQLEEKGEVLALLRALPSWPHP